VKNHADFVFMQGQAERRSSLSGNKFDVIAHKAFALAFERNVLQADELAK